MGRRCHICDIKIWTGHTVVGPVTTSPARLAQSVEHETLNLRVVGSSPTLGVIFSTIFKRNQSYFFGISRFKSRKSPPLCLYYGRILAYVGPYILVRMSRKCGAVA